ncbi:MAG: phosphoheptose isomerase [Odoribacter sp.]|nr:phosphoheptose isomerase [Odoribacter sp.]
MEEIKKQIEESVRVKNLLLKDEKILREIEQASDLCISALKSGLKIILAGNGGSAADAQHIAGELVNRFGFDRPGLSAISLTTDTSIITSISNDYGFEKLFSRQIQALGKKGDVLIAISTSGNSPNIIEAIKEAKKTGIITIGLTGKSGGRMLQFCDLCLKVPSDGTARIQEAHILIGHIICSLIEKELFNK